MDEKRTSAEVFRACALTLLNMELDPQAASDAAVLFRDGTLAARLADILDGLAAARVEQRPRADTSPKLSPPKPPARTETLKQRTVSTATAAAIFDDVKRKKISKGQLFALFDQINSEVANRFPEDISMREAIRDFQEFTSQDDWKFLVDVIRGSSGADPYLAQLSSSK